MRIADLLGRMLDGSPGYKRPQQDETEKRLRDDQIRHATIHGLGDVFVGQPEKLLRIEMQQQIFGVGYATDEVVTTRLHCSRVEDRQLGQYRGGQIDDCRVRRKAWG